MAWKGLATYEWADAVARDMVVSVDRSNSAGFTVIYKRRDGRIETMAEATRVLGFDADVRLGRRLGIIEEGSLLSLMTDPAFVAACKAAGIEPTRRQASKWKNKQGRAWAKRDRSREPFPDYRAPRARDHEEF